MASTAAQHDRQHRRTGGMSAGQPRVPHVRRRSVTGVLAALLAAALAAAVPAAPAAAAPPQPAAPGGPGQPAAATAPQPAAPDEAARLAAEAATLRARMDEQHRRLEVLSERLNAARDRGAQLLLGTDQLDRRWQGATDELAAARADLERRSRELTGSGAGFWTTTRAGFAQALESATRMRPRWLAVDERQQQRKRDVDDGRQRLARAEAAMATMELEKAQLSGSLVAQASEAERLHAMEQEAGELAASLQAQVRQMDRRVADLIEAERQREEAEARAAFTSWAAGRPGAGGAGAATEAARHAIEVALSQRGKHYQWGAEGPDTFDCSGLMQYAYAAAGVSIPRVSRDQYAAFAPERAVAMADLRPGDLVFFADRPADPRTIHHVGMYIGDGLMVEAPYTGATVRTSSIMRPSYAGAIRPMP